MFNHELYAATLARAVELMRQKDAREAQKTALRALVTLSAAGSATVRCYDGVLSIDDVAIDSDVPHTGTLAGRIAAHNIAEIAIGRGAEPAELFALLKGLAEGPYGAPQVKDRLREAKSARIWVLLSDMEEQRKRNSVSHLFDPPAEEIAAPRAPGAPPAKPGSREEAAEALAAWDALHSVGDGNSTIKNIDFGLDVSPEPEPAAAGPPPPRKSQPRGPLPALPIDGDTPLGKALMQVALRPHDGDVLDRLTVLTEHVQAALTGDRLEEALHVLAMLATFETGAPEGTPKNSYRITLRRILSRDTLVQLAPFTTDPQLADEASRVLARAGADATDVLLGLLASSESIRERKGYMNALRNVPHGREQIPVMLGHPQWFVVRNVAELVGEMRLEEATGELAKLLNHDDQRVRRAAAIALAKMGTPAASEPLRVAMKDGTPELRTLVASLVGSFHAASLAGPLVLQLETEEDPAVLKEMCGALARIGTAEAVQALERASKGGGMFSRRGRALRESAGDALKRVRKT